MWTGDMARQAGDIERTRLMHRLGRTDLRAVPEARHALRSLLEDWGGPGQSETAELLATELVTNALLHTDGEAVLTATVDSYSLHVEVRDFAPRIPKPRSPIPDNGTHGRGLMLVQSLADAWGVRAPSGERSGKVVWFELQAGGP